MKLSRDPYNCVGKLVLEACKKAGKSYSYACMMEKISQ